MAARQVRGGVRVVSTVSLRRTPKRHRVGVPGGLGASLSPTRALTTRPSTPGPQKPRTSRLRRLAEDAALITGSAQTGAADHGVDPTVLVAERKIVDAARRGVFDARAAEPQSRWTRLHFGEQHYELWSEKMPSPTARKKMVHRLKDLASDSGTLWFRRRSRSDLHCDRAHPAERALSVGLSELTPLRSRFRTSQAPRRRQAPPGGH